MEKIKFMADTACDIPDEQLKEYYIDMPSVPITVDGEGYFERKSFSIEEFYGVLAKSKEIPATSRVPVADFQECYQRAYREGYTHIINVTINSTGSGTNASAHMAKELFFSENPEAAGKIEIHIVDSRSYAIAYGYPVVQAARMAREGKTAAEILEYLEDWFSRIEIYLGCYSLEYAKKSGRINAAAAFVGDVLGLRPIISLIDGQTKVVEKVRGDKQVIPHMLEILRKRHTPGEKVLPVCGEILEYGHELQAALQEQTGQESELYRIGASIAINSGPKIVALCFLGPKRPAPQREE